MTKKIFFLLLILAISRPLFARGIRVAPPSSEKDVRKKYYYDLIRLIFKNIEHKDYSLSIESTKMNQVRAIRSLIDNSIDLVWSMSSKERNEQLSPIRIPLLKNYLGFRICFISKSNSNNVEYILKSKGYKGLNYIQGIGWPDIMFLERSNLSVMQSHYSNIFEILRKGRTDCFLRSILEIEAEVNNKLLTKSLVVEPTIAFSYDAPMYFYVRKGDKSFRKDIEYGLKKIIKSGEFEKLFQRYYDGVLQKYNYKSRKVIKL